MAEQNYNWTRFWIPHGESFWPDGAFLSEPISRLGRSFNPKCVTLESIEADTSCLVLLGEPGIGKSKEIEKQKSVTMNRAKERGEKALFFDLGDYGSEAALLSEIFRRPKFEDWLRSNQHLNLFLDSLDEGLITARSLTRLLSRKLTDLPLDRLRLRIACRTAEWQSVSFENSLRELFGDDDVRVFELCPLCRPDAEYAADQNGIDPSHFMKEVARSDVEAFVSKPVTLNFLLKLFKKNNEFPNTQTVLYLKGCLELCRDTEKRKELRRTGAFDPEQRLILAARIAAMMMFGNRSRIWIGRQALDAEEQDVTIRELCGETESRDGELFAANEAAIREVLEYTGLFSSGGRDRLRWRHQTYAEFLAVLYLDKRNFTLTKKLDLILHFGDPEKKVAPQLHETAAWLAGMDNLVFEEILKSEPEILLRSDVAKADEKDRERLVAALLKLYHEDERPTAWFTFSLLRRLSHPALAKQLRPFISDNSKWITSRALAIQIAHACERKELQDVLANLALDASAPVELRCDAMDAVGEIGDHETKLRLKPLTVDDPPDQYKQLKGHAFMALWPSCLTSDELFDSITFVTPDFYGAYDRFISDLAEGMSQTDVLPALGWLRQRPNRDSSSASMNKLKDAIVVLGWNNIDMPGAADLFARIALSKLMSHEILIEGRSPWDDITRKPPPPALGKLIRDDDQKRRIVLSAMIDILSEYVSSEEGKDKFGAFSFSNPFLVGSDLEWFVEQFENTDSEHKRFVLLHLISWVFHQWDVDHIEALLAAVQRNDLIAANFRHLFREIQLDSEYAAQLRAQHGRSLRMRERHIEQPPRLEPSPAERIVECLDKFEFGDYAAWTELNYWMVLGPDGTYESEYEPDLRSSPGWQSADDHTKARIIGASLQYLLHGNPDTDNWLLTEGWPDLPAAAGYKGLYLLMHENPEAITALNADVWRLWAPVALAMISSGLPHEDIQGKLIAIAYTYAPTEILSTLTILIERQSRDLRVPHIVEKIERLWDNDIADVIRHKVTDESLNAESISYLFEKLLSHNDERARSLAESYLQFPTSPTEEQLSRAVAAGRSLIFKIKDGAWSALWPIIQRDNHFGRTLVEAVANQDSFLHRNDIPIEMNETQLAELYIWLTNNYPHAEDPKSPRSGSYKLTSRRLVASWRDSIPTRLARYGTSKACEQIRRIEREYPELKWLKWILRSAEDQTRRNTWDPIKPKEILKLAKDSSLGLVKSEEQLLRIVIGSLRELQKKLDDGAWHELWNEDPVRKPKDEDELVRKVESYLRETLTSRGVIPNREVEVHPRGRSDIRIDAIKKLPNGDAYNRISLIIEAKGCWHDRLKKAMQEQLVERYLIEDGCNHGLYLVGWFKCDEWNSSDWRKRRSPAWTLQMAQEFFEGQASRLSKEGKLIRAFVLNIPVSGRSPRK